MPLSKARNAARMRNVRALARGVQPSATQLIEVMSTNQRKERLAELITMPIDPEKFNPSHIISAIDIYNKMDKIYQPDQVNYTEIKILVVRSDGNEGNHGTNQDTTPETS